MIRKIALLLCLLASLLLCLPASATTVSGTVKKPDGAGITGTLQLELSAVGITGSELVLIQPRVTCAISAGAIGACTVKGNDTITDPAGTYYCLRIVSAGGQELLPAKPYTISGASFNLGSATQLADKKC